MEMIPINRPLLDDEEVESVCKVLRSGVLTSRTRASTVGRFEKGFAEYVRAKHAFAVNSGTAALHLSLLAAKLGRGCEVIVPSFTFVATAETIVLVGAKPVFVDIRPDTYNIDPQKIKKAITKRTRAIMPVDLYGLPADMKPIGEIAETYGLNIIEDAAQAHGARYAGKPVGCFADLACWSFYASKNMTTGEGGIITTNSDEYAEILPHMRSHGEKKEYVSSIIGHNFRMPEMEAAVGVVQLRKLPKFLALRRRNAKRLTAGLKKTKELQLPTVPDNYKHSWYLFTVRLKNTTQKKRDKIVGELKKVGICAAVYYPTPVHLMPFYRKFSKHRLPNTEKAAKQVLSLPVHPAVTTRQIDYIAASLKKLV